MNILLTVSSKTKANFDFVVRQNHNLKKKQSKVDLCQDGIMGNDS